MSLGYGGPNWGAGSQDDGTPDWDALADDVATTRARRRRWLFIGGGAVATVAIGAIVALAVTQSDTPSDESSSGGSSQPSEPKPTFSDVKPPPPPDPRDYISDAAKDTAPLSAKSLFPHDPLRRGGHSYARGATDSTTRCAQAAPGDLGPILERNSCQRLLRATYAQGNVAVTVGVAVFQDEATALNVADNAKGSVQSLPGDGVPTFCRHAVCRTTAYAMGRYAYFTIAGYTDGEQVSKGDTRAASAGKIAANYAYNRIMQRGRAQASAAATAPSARR